MSMRASDTSVRLSPSETTSNHPWQPDLGNGHYRNPIIFADYSDPDVIRMGEDFFMTASSFNCTPGLPILHSCDLVNWHLINHAVKNLPDPHYGEVQAGCGIWAPAIRFYDGKFWIAFATPDEGIFVTTATDPAGQWSEPHLLLAGKGMIDPCPFWDNDGKAYLVHAYAKSRAGIKHCLRLYPMSPDATHLLGEGHVVFSDPVKHPTLEGPKFIKRNGWYYILAPAGGVATGWQTVLRSRNIYGPYEDKIVLEQGSTNINGPHQGALVDTPTGQWWFIHFQDAGVYGRITHLQPVEWMDGWPMMGLDQDGNGIGEPVLQHEKPDIPAVLAPVVPQTTDEFDSARLGLQWQWNANHRDEWYSLTDRPGWARLFAEPMPENSLAKSPHLLMQKFPAPEFTVETYLELAPGSGDTEAGLVVMGREYAAIALVRERESCKLLFHSNGRTTLLLSSRITSIRFRVEVSAGGHCLFSYGFREDEFIDAPSPFRAMEGIWVGARVGIYASTASPTSNGYADFNYFRFSPRNSGQNASLESRNDKEVESPSWLGKKQRNLQ